MFTAYMQQMQYLEDGLLDDLRVNGGHTVYGLAAHNSQISHVHQPAHMWQLKDVVMSAEACEHMMTARHTNGIFIETSRGSIPAVICDMPN